MSKVLGLSLDDWAAAFRPGIVETTGERFIYTKETGGLRLVFGNNGPVIDKAGTRAPVYHHAITLPVSVALDMARAILAVIAEQDQPPGAIDPQP